MTKTSPNLDDRATSHFPPKVSDTPVPEGSTDLVYLQARIGRWALRTFGPTPAAVHAARMDREMADVHDCVAMGDMATLGRALAGVLVVGLALAESHDIDLAGALLTEQDDNEASEWIQDSWGQWLRNGDGAVKDDAVSLSMANLVHARFMPPDLAVKILKDRGASQNAAIEYLSKYSGVPESHFEAPRTENLTPAARGVDTKFRPFVGRVMPKGDSVTADQPLQGVGYD